MDKAEAFSKYKDIVPISIFKQYENADKYVYINIDKDLQKVRIPLPEPPDWKLIEGFGLPADEQVFTYEVYPKKLLLLEQELKDKYDSFFINKEISANKRDKFFHSDIYETIKANKDEYAEEIEWIKKQWGYRLYGKWIFIQGKPTYICGWHWMYLNYWNLEGVGRPEYRYTDMLWFLSAWYAYRCKEIPVIERIGDGTPVPVYEKDGTLKMMNVGYRTMFGFNVVKNRRAGDSSKASLITYEIISRLKQVRGGIQGNKESTAGQIFKDKMLVGISNMPWFFKPRMKNYTATKVLDFSDDSFGGGLQSRIDYATTAKKNYYDNAKLKVYQAEEPGKTIGESILKRHNTIKECCSLHAKIYGFMIYCTTTYDDDDGVGISEEFKKLCNESHFQIRNDNGQTISGLMNVFFPADMRLDGFFDIFGNPISMNPTKRQLKYIPTKVYNSNGEPIGAREFLLNQRKEAEREGKHDTLSDLKRAYPLCWRDSFTPPALNLIFNVNVIEERILYLENEGRGLTRKGNLVWLNGVPDTQVIWIDDEINGRFTVSRMPESFGIKKTTKKRYDSFYPLFKHKFIASADPFKIEQKDHYKMSRGGGAVRWMYDPEVDGDKKSKYDYESQRLIMTYQYKPNTLEEYYEDMLMMAVFWGAYMYPEENVPGLSKYFIDRGYSAFLLYEVDPITGRAKDTPGWTTDRVNKPQLFNLVREDLEYHAHKCDHVEFLRDCISMRSPEDMRRYDRFTAVAGTIRGEYILSSTEEMTPNDGIDVGDIYRLLGK